MKHLVLMTFLLGLCLGCSPRVHLRDNTGLSLKRVLALQNAVRPQSKLAPLTAQDAKIIMANHLAGHAKSGNSSRSSSASSSRGGVGPGEVELREPPRVSMRRRD